MARYFIKNKGSSNTLLAMTFQLNDVGDIKENKIGVIQFKDLSEIDDDAEIIEVYEDYIHQSSGIKFKTFANGVFPTFKRFVPV